MKNYELQAFLQFDDGSTGNAAANKSFNVTIARGASVGNDATIYQDADGTTEITRPFQTDQYGRFKFYAANGYYNILFDDPDVANLNNLLDRDIFTVEQATESIVGLSRYSTSDEAAAGENDTSSMTPLKTHQSFNQFGIGSSDFADNAFGNDANNLNKTGGFLLVNSINTPKEGAAFFVNNMFRNGQQGIGFQIANEQGSGDYFVRSKSSLAGIGTSWFKSLTSGNFIFLMNSKGSTIVNNEVTSGASLTPPQTGSWRNVSGNDVNNNSYGLFQKV